jgi:hypothetical protein
MSDARRSLITGLVVAAGSVADSTGLIFALRDARRLPGSTRRGA